MGKSLYENDEQVIIRIDDSCMDYSEAPMEPDFSQRAFYKQGAPTEQAWRS